MGRILSLIISLGYLIAASIYSGDITFVLVTVVYIIFCLVLIWFGDAIGDITGFGFPGSLAQGSPAIIVGWFLLLLPLVGGAIIALIR